jgi:CBS domain-containing protein
VNVKARDVMTKAVISVGVNDVVDDALRSLNSRGRMAAPVLDDDGRLVGLITAEHLILALLEAELHLIRAFLGPIRRRRCQTVGEIMSTPVASLTAGADIAQVEQMLQDQNAPCLLIVDGYSVVGLIDRRDLRRHSQRAQ